MQWNAEASLIVVDHVLRFVEATTHRETSCKHRVTVIEDVTMFYREFELINEQERENAQECLKKFESALLVQFQHLYLRQYHQKVTLFFTDYTCEFARTFEFC